MRSARSTCIWYKNDTFAIEYKLSFIWESSTFPFKRLHRNGRSPIFYFRSWLVFVKLFATPLKCRQKRTWSICTQSFKHVELWTRRGRGTLISFPSWILFFLASRRPRSGSDDLWLMVVLFCLQSFTPVTTRVSCRDQKVQELKVLICFLFNWV